MTSSDSTVQTRKVACRSLATYCNIYKAELYERLFHRSKKWATTQECTIYSAYYYYRLMHELCWLFNAKSTKLYNSIENLWDQVTLVDFLLLISTYKVSKYPVIYDQCFFGEEQKIGPNYLQFFCRIPKIRELPGVWRYFRGFWQTGSHFSNNVAW